MTKLDVDVCLINLSLGEFTFKLGIVSPTSVGVERSGPSIHSVLAEHAPERCAEFEAEFRIALAEADDDFDLSRVQRVIDKWWPIAYSTLHPPTDEERALVARVRAGDFSGLWQPDDDSGAHSVSVGTKPS